MNATQYLGTASKAAAMLALGFNLYPSTASPVGSEYAVRTVCKTATALPNIVRKKQVGSTYSTYDFGSTAVEQLMQANVAERQTSPVERIVGELRRWATLSANWDGQGATAPRERSVKESVAFVRLLAPGIPLPDPMMHANGRAGLFWQEGDLYADLEFLGDGHMAYFVERGGDKHKGVIQFNSQNLPPVMNTLLQG